jgi:GNAT superfamily N-acetyltransferase
MQIRLATAADTNTLAALRVALLEETGGPLPPADRAEMQRLNEAFFLAHSSSSAWSHWLAEAQGQVVAVGSLSFFVRPPYPGNPEGKDAYFLNMYTRPEFRGQRAADRVLKAAIEHAAQRGVCKLILHATEAGRPMYLKAGFKPSASYMELALPAAGDEAGLST